MKFVVLFLFGVHALAIFLVTAFVVVFLYSSRIFLCKTSASSPPPPFHKLDLTHTHTHTHTHYTHTHTHTHTHTTQAAKPFPWECAAMFCSVAQLGSLFSCGKDISVDPVPATDRTSFQSSDPWSHSQWKHWDVKAGWVHRHRPTAERPWRWDSGKALCWHYFTISTNANTGSSGSVRSLLTPRL